MNNFLNVKLRYEPNFLLKFCDKKIYLKLQQSKSKIYLLISLSKCFKTTKTFKLYRKCYKNVN